jgi:hypothetical protein
MKYNLPKVDRYEKLKTHRTNFCAFDLNVVAVQPRHMPPAQKSSSSSKSVQPPRPMDIFARTSVGLDIPVKVEIVKTDDG